MQRLILSGFELTCYSALPPSLTHLVYLDIPRTNMHVDFSATLPQLLRLQIQLTSDTSFYFPISLTFLKVTISDKCSHDFSWLINLKELKVEITGKGSFPVGWPPNAKKLKLYCTRPIPPEELLLLPISLKHLNLVESNEAMQERWWNTSEFVWSLPRGLTTLKIRTNLFFDCSSFECLPPGLCYLKLYADVFILREKHLQLLPPDLGAIQCPFTSSITGAFQILKSRGIQDLGGADDTTDMPEQANR